MNASLTRACRSTAAWINGAIDSARLNATLARAFRSTAAWINGPIDCARLNASLTRDCRSTAAWINGPIDCARLSASLTRACRSIAAWINGAIGSYRPEEAARDAAKNPTMRFGSYRAGETERAAVLLGDPPAARGGAAPYDVEAVAAAADVRVPPTLEEFIREGAVDRFRTAVGRLGGPVPVAPLDRPRLVCPLRRPPKIWGIGLNYRAHAQDLGVAVPDEPASFMKPATTLIGPDETILLPPQSQRVTAEAELALVLGRRAVDVAETDVPSVLFGYVPIIDMTAEDILQRNPRFLTRAKSFATFLSVGPWIATPDDIPAPAGLRVTTLRRGEVAATNTVSDMRFAPAMLVAFFSRVFEWEPGDLLLTGTPGAAVVEDGDVAGCRIDGFPELQNPVRRLQSSR